MKKILLLVILVTFFGCSLEKPSQFSKESLTENFISIEGKEISIGTILNQYKGKKVLINVWASWCKDCIVGLPNLKKLQEENPTVVYLFLSLDRNIMSWKSGLDRFDIKGEHYFMKEGKKGAFGSFLNLWWVPRYVAVNEKSDITLYKATKITDKNIVEALKK
ncbi:MAG: TlpA family protein disulfide reductase [Flavobacteriaceae bacterium]